MGTYILAMEKQEKGLILIAAKEKGFCLCHQEKSAQFYLLNVQQNEIGYNIGCIRMTVFVKKVSSQEEINQCLLLRKIIFVEGQNVPLHEEIDGQDEVAEHYLLFYEGTRCGVARVRYIDGVGKVERVGVLDAYQGRGLGQTLMMQILSDLKMRHDVNVVKLSSQTHAISFYQKLGFRICSEEYIDANIPHHDMILYFFSK